MTPTIDFQHAGMIAQNLALAVEAIGVLEANRNAGDWLALAAMTCRAVVVLGSHLRAFPFLRLHILFAVRPNELKRESRGSNPTLLPRAERRHRNFEKLCGGLLAKFFFLAPILQNF